MRFRSYLRWDGSLAIAVGAFLFTLGLVKHHQGLADAVVDFAVWAMAVGAIKAGPAVAAIAEHEACSRTTYRVARRPLRGVVRLVQDETDAPPIA